MQSPVRSTSKILSALQGSGSPSGQVIGQDDDQNYTQNSGQNQNLRRGPSQTKPQQKPGLQTALSTLDQVLTEIENSRQQVQDEQPGEQVVKPVPVAEEEVSQVVAPSVPLAVDQQVAQQQAQQQQVGSTAKESLVGATPDQGGVESATGIAYVEQEKSPELPVEVEGYLQKVEEHAGQQPQKIVISDDQNVPLASKYPKKSVIVLPITPEIEKQGQNKNPKFSIRWLVEWSRKLMKMFSGKIIYKQTEETQA